VFLAIKEILRLIFILLVTTFITFAMLYDSPDIVAENILVMKDIVPTKEAIESIKKERGLDKPFVAQYTSWLIGIANADFGYSHSMNRPVKEEFLLRLPNTLMLAGYAIVIMVSLSLLLGILSSIYRGSLLDRAISIFSSIIISIPVFWMGLLLILVFIVNFSLFELTRMNTPRNIILPAIALALPLIGRYTILIRASFLEQISSNYITGAKVRGVAKSTIMLRHVLPNAIIVILPPVGISIGAILGGTVIIEMIFSIYGLGAMVLLGIDHSDYPLIKSFVLLMTVTYISISFFIDWTCKLLDPRLRAKR